MTTSKRTALIFLGAVNLINIIAGITTQLTMAFEWDVTSIIPIKNEMTVDGILLFNFMAVVVVTTLINVVTTYLATDFPYPFTDIIKNCPFISLIVPLLLVIAAIYNSILAQSASDRIFIILSAAVYVLLNVINFGCMATIKEDAE